MGTATNITELLFYRGKKAFATYQNMLNQPKAKDYKLEASVLLAAMLLGSILIFRSLRHRTAWRFTKPYLIAACYFSTHAISYVLAKLDSYVPFNANTELEAIIQIDIVFTWAVFLVVFYGMTDSSGSDTLQFNEENRKRFLWDKMIPSLWLFILLIWSFPNQLFSIPILLLWILYIFKLRERKQALIYACRSRVGLDRVTMVIAEYMKDEQTYSPEGEIPNPNTMQGYKYLVGVDHALDQVVSVCPPCHEERLDLDKIATLDKVWHCQGWLLGQTCDPDGHLKDTCLSFALFWLLLRRFAGYELEELSCEESREKTWNFVSHGLLKEQEDGNECERGLRVVEVELQFLHDYLFNNYFAVYCKGSRFLIIRLIVLAVFLLMSAVMILLTAILYEISQLNGAYVVITIVVVITLGIVEFFQITNIVTSRWNKVKWVCSYVQKKWWETRLGRFKEKLLHMLWSAPCFTPCISPWHRKLRQYSLLDSYGYNPWLLKFRLVTFILDGYIEFPIRGQKQDKPADLTTEVLKAVIFSLQTNGRRLSNGVASLQRNQVEDKLSWACKSNKTVTQIILVWHIATSLCEMSLSNNKDPSNVDVDIHVATALSKYCAYLVAFVPKLLPDHVYTTQWHFEHLVFEMREKLKKCNSMESKYQKLTSSEIGSAYGSTLEQGALLGKHLMHIIDDASLRWKVLANFWAEMILFLAPSKDATAHADYLATNAEFITHLWALLTHAGIVDRDGCVDY